MLRRARLDTPRSLHRVMIGGIEARNITDDDRDRRDVERRLSRGISALLPISEDDLGDFALRG